MIDLYASVSPNVVKIFIALEEMALPYATHVIELMKGANFEPDFVKLSPTAKVPVIVDQDSAAGRPYTVFESGAILIYLAEKSGKFLPSDVIGRNETLQWLMLQMANVGPTFGQSAHFSHFAPQDEVAYARARFRTIVRNMLDLINNRLGQVPYIAGSSYTITDMAFLPWMQSVDFILGDGALAEYPNIKVWADGLAARPAVVRALETTADLRRRITPRDQAPPEILDRYFGRGAHNKK